MQELNSFRDLKQVIITLMRIYLHFFSHGFENVLPQTNEEFA